MACTADGSTAPSFPVRSSRTFAGQYTGQSNSARGVRRPKRSSTLPKLAQTVGSSSRHLAAPDLFRLQPVSWRRPQLCPGSGRVEKVRYGLLGLVWTTTIPPTCGEGAGCFPHFQRTLHGFLGLAHPCCLAVSPYRFNFLQLRWESIQHRAYY